MSYTIVMSKSQLQLIAKALNNLETQPEKDEFGDNIHEVAKQLAAMTLAEQEDNTINGWIV